MLAESCKNIIQRDALKNTAVVLIIYGIQFLLFQDIFRLVLLVQITLEEEFRSVGAMNRNNISSVYRCPV